jgi:hypothetical protein
MLGGGEGWSTGWLMKQYLVRLDRIAGELNVWLLVVAIGLGVLDLTMLIAKYLPALPQTPVVVSADQSRHRATSLLPNFSDGRS